MVCNLQNMIWFCTGFLKQNKNEENKFSFVTSLHSFRVNTRLPNSICVLEVYFIFFFCPEIQLVSFGKPFGSSVGLGLSDLGFAGSGQPLSLLDYCVGGGSERSATRSLCDKGRRFPESDVGNVLFPSCFSTTNSEPSIIRDSFVPGQQANDRKKCLSSPCQNVMPIPLETRP